MNYYAVYNLVGIAVDDSYPWTDTLFITQGVARKSKEDYEKCQRIIKIVYNPKLCTKDLRTIGDGAYIGENVYADEKYGVRIEKSEFGFSLFVAQECNEWLVIALQLSLLSCNYTLIHGAALEKDNEVLLLPSWGGVGKTATVCHFVRGYGWRLLGDDLVIMGEGRVLPFLKPFVLYPYHRVLFPEAFQQGAGHTVKSLVVSEWMSRVIPSVKRALRPFPRVLAYLRKHNPQSIRVDPRKLFTTSQLSDGGKVKRMIWLERSVVAQVAYRDLQAEAVASKAVAVSCVELFAAKLEAVYHMCGCGMLDFDKIFVRMQEIIKTGAKDIPCGIVEIPTSVSITEVGDVIYHQLNK